MLICTCIFTPAFAWWNNIQDTTVFKESEVNLEEDLPSLVDEDSPFFQAFSDANRRLQSLFLRNDQHRPPPRGIPQPQQPAAP